MPLRSLDISNGCQDHTTSPYTATFDIASASHVLPSEVLKKALKRRSSCAPDRSLTDLSDPPCDDQRARRCRVHRISTRVRDDRDPPLCG
jgi:hypothetical protein